MVSISKYKEIFNPEKGVFHREQRGMYLSGVRREAEIQGQGRKDPEIKKKNKKDLHGEPPEM